MVDVAPPPPEQNVVAVKQVDVEVADRAGRVRQTSGILWDPKENVIRVGHAADTEATLPCNKIEHPDLEDLFSGNAINAAKKVCGAPGTSFATVIDLSKVPPAFKYLNRNPIGTYAAFSDHAGNVTIGETSMGLRTSFSRAANGFIPEYRPTGLEGLMGSSAGRLEAARQEINIQLGMKP